MLSLIRRFHYAAITPRFFAFAIISPDFRRLFLRCYFSYLMPPAMLMLSLFRFHFIIFFHYLPRCHYATLFSPPLPLIAFFRHYFRFHLFFFRLLFHFRDFIAIFDAIIRCQRY